MSFSKIRTLVLYANYTDQLSYYDDWRDAFQSAPDFAVTVANICRKHEQDEIKKNLAEYDFIVLLHSVLADTLKFVTPLKEALRERKSKLLAFVGNEVNLPLVPLKDKIGFIQDIRAEFVGTQLPLAAGQWLYSECQETRVVALPHALNPAIFFPAVAPEKRPIDIGTRTHEYGPYMGDNERNELLKFFSKYKFPRPLKIDLSANSRFDRAGWAGFLNNCKGTIATEAGSYYLEKDDHTINAIFEYIRQGRKQPVKRIVNYNSRIQGVYERLPHPLKLLVKNIMYPAAKKLFKVKHQFQAFEGIGFSEIYDKFYRHYPLNQPPVYTKAISSRHFDAIGTKTCQIMFKGEFNGILQADRHYLALERNFSNIDNVMKRFLDTGYRQEMVSQTYEYILAEHTYQHRLKTIRRLLD